MYIVMKLLCYVIDGVYTINTHEGNIVNRLMHMFEILYQKKEKK